MSRYGKAFDDARAYEHWLKYETMIGLLGKAGLQRLTAVVLSFTREEDLQQALRRPGGHSLNSIPLGNWDMQHDRVRGIVRETFAVWSLSDTVCLLKHVARHHVCGVAAPENVTDELSDTRRAEVLESISRMRRK